MEIFRGYDGASHSKRGVKEWTPGGGDADTDILDNLPDLRERSRDLVRNNPLAAGAIKTKVTNVVGTGLRLQSRIDRDILNLSEDQADAWEKTTEREWRLYWESQNCDITRTQNGHGLTRMVYQQAKENGDVFVLLPEKPVQGFPYSRRLQVIEADRVTNKDNAQDTEKLAGGIQKDGSGAPVAYHVLDQHPGNLAMLQNSSWTIVPAYGKQTGIRNIIHLYTRTRPGQSRGVPDLAAVIEPLKQLGRYTEAEIMAAVISGMFTVFIKSGDGGTEFDYSKLGTETGHTASDKDIKLGNGMIVSLDPGEEVHDSNPGRPNTAFDPFVQSVLRQIGVALEIPFEILIKHFTASYSAARAALLEMWKFVLSERRWLCDSFLKPVYEVWMYEAVVSGRISAPGFLSDAAIRAAYLGADFVGPSKGQIDELKEVKAARERLGAGLSTLAQETAELTGGDWERNHPQQVKEHNKRLDDGLVVLPPEPGAEVEDIEE
jgi:lambda family phage portal protein